MARAIKQAFDDNGQPTVAALGFAKSVGLEVSQLTTQTSEKGEWLFCQINQPGQSAKKLIPECIQMALKALPISKRMRWGTLESEFIRPVKWLIILLDDEVIDTEILSTKAGRHTYGHRFHAARRLRLRRAQDYEQLLEQEGLVILDFAQRRQQILRGINELAEKQNAQVLLDEDLLDEVTGLVELPVPLIGSIEERFMSLPQEVLISSMQDHQKYFPVIDENNKMLPFFITVSNIRSKDESSVIEGNERVLRSRLSDAQFFYDSDSKIPLKQRAGLLNNVLFHKKLGTVSDKVDRISHLAAYLAEKLGYDKKLTIQSAELCKADLVTDMVGEFPELQGVMGKYYALNDGEPSAVATAIEEHYLPRFAGERIPQSDIGRVLAIADKLDTICGIFAANEVPSGDRDPFALRRASLGILRILLEGNLDIDLIQAINAALAGYKHLNLKKSSTEEIYGFIFERLKSYYQSKGYDTREYQSVAVLQPASPVDFENRIKAVNQFAKLEEAATLIEANKRIANILQKTKVINTEVDSGVLDQPEEQALYEQVQMVSDRLAPLVEQNRYADVMKMLTVLKEPIDDFFDNVMVMDEDPVKRDNRIALLSAIKQLFNITADVSYLK